MTETAMVQVTCPDCRREFDVPDGAAEAQCPQCGEALVWRSCLDTNEIFTVLKKWETWIHPGCDTKHPVDLTHVISAARPQDPISAPITESTVYAPVELANDVEWADQDISGRLIVDSDRLAILPGPGVARAPLSVAWLHDVQTYAVHRADQDGEKRKRFGRRKGDATARPTLVVFTVPGGQISITSAAQPDVLLGQLDQFLRPRMSQPPVAPVEAAAPVAPVAPAVEVAGPEAAGSEIGGPEAAGSEVGAPEAAVPEAAVPEGVVPEAVAPEAAVAEAAAPEAAGETPPEDAAPEDAAPEDAASEDAAPEDAAPADAAPAEEHAASAAVPQAPQGLDSIDPSRLPDLDPKTPEAVYESIRKLAELAVLGAISSEEFATKKAQLLSRL